MMSFQRDARGDGWRYSLTHRTRRDGVHWILERWDGEDWISVGRYDSYATVREAAGEEVSS